jgi:hypothetical protein
LSVAPLLDVADGQSLTQPQTAATAILTLSEIFTALSELKSVFGIKFWIKVEKWLCTKTAQRPFLVTVLTVKHQI